MRISKIYNSILAPVVFSILCTSLLLLYWGEIADLIPNSRFNEFTSMVALVICTFTVTGAMKAFSHLQDMKFRRQQAERRATLARTIEGHMAIMTAMMTVAEELQGGHFIAVVDPSVLNFVSPDEMEFFIRDGLLVVDIDVSVIERGPHFDQAIFDSHPPQHPKGGFRFVFAVIIAKIWRRIEPFLSYLFSPGRWSASMKRLIIVLFFFVAFVMAVIYAYLAWAIVRWLGKNLGDLIVGFLNFLKMALDPAHPIDYFVVSVCLSLLVLCRFWSRRIIRRRINQLRLPVALYA